MSLSDALRDKLHLPGVKAGPVEVETDEGSAQVELVEGDGIGVRVNRVRVNVAGSSSVGKQAEKICEKVRCLGDRLVPVEVEPRLQGGFSAVTQGTCGTGSISRWAWTVQGPPWSATRRIPIVGGIASPLP